MKKLPLASFVILLLSIASFAHSAPPAGCENETGLVARDDILKCEPWENSTWWQSGWYRDQGNTGQSLDGRRFYQFPVDSTYVNGSQDFEIVTTGCMVGSCLKVNMPGVNALGNGQGIMAMSWVIPGVGGCSHSTLGCVPQQDVYMRYYMKLGSNFDPDNISTIDGTSQGGGGKFPGLADATNGASGTPSEQCGNGGEGPTNGTECWSARLNFNVCAVTSNGPHNVCIEGGQHAAKTRFGWYPYIYNNGVTGGTRFSSVFWDSDDRGMSLPGACTNTFGFSCASPGLRPGIVNDKWYLVEVRIKMNAPGAADGIMQAWLDGEQVYSKTNVIFRMPGHNNLGVRLAWFDVYIGGVNVVLPEASAVYFDQMVISTDARPGPWTGIQRANMVAVNQDPAIGMNGFSRAHSIPGILPNYQDLYLSPFGAGSPFVGDNSIRLANFGQLVNSLPGAWTYAFPSDSGADVNTLRKRDNHISMYFPWLPDKPFIISGGSYIWPNPPSDGSLISGVMPLVNCAPTPTTGCAWWATTSRWTVNNTATNWNAAFRTSYVVNGQARPPLVKNAMFYESAATDMAAACNVNIQKCMRGWGFDSNGRHYITENNESNVDFAQNSICNTGSASGSEPLIDCQLPASPKNLPVFSNGADCSLTPTGGTTPGWRSQALNTLVAGPDKRRAFYIVGTFATNCPGTGVPLIVNDFWVYSAETKMWTELAAPPAASYTPLAYLDSVRNAVMVHVNDKLYAYPLFGQNAWQDVTPTSGFPARFNHYGSYVPSNQLFVFQDGNTPDGNPAPQGVSALSMNSAAILSEPVVGFTAITSSGSESNSPALIGVGLANPPAGTVTVNYSVTGGTATGGGVDYALASGQLSFSGGTVLQNISVTVVNDGEAEGDETIQLTLSGATGGATIGTAVHTFTILANDQAGGQRSPAVTLQSGKQIRIEQGKPLVVQ